MRKIFKENSIEKEFLENGYVVIPFGNVQELELLEEQLRKFKPSDNFKGNQDTLLGKQSFHVTFFDNNNEYKKKMLAFAKNTFQPLSDTILEGYKCVQGNVFLKPPQSGIVFPHQNLTIVDETKYTTLSFWLPLQNTTKENGTLCLIPKTQNSFVKYRNTHVYYPYTDFLASEEGQQYFTPIHLQKGELLILDDRIIHYTPINHSKKDRWVLHALWAPQEAQIRYYDPVNDKINVYNVSDDFWQYHAPGSNITKTEPDEIIVNDELIYTEKEFVEVLKKYKNS